MYSSVASAISFLYYNSKGRHTIGIQVAGNCRYDSHRLDGVGNIDSLVGGYQIVNTKYYIIKILNRAEI